MQGSGVVNMRESETGQVTRSAAEVYEEFFVPALFEQWADRMVDAAAIESGHRVLDVACGTGVLARAASDRAGPGAVVGLDVNAGMLAVATRKAPEIEWQRGRADALRAPFSLGDRESLGRLLAQAGIDDAQIATREGTARFASIQSWMFTDVKGWTLADQIDDRQFELLVKEAADVLQPFAKFDGSVAFDMPAHIVTVTKH